MKILSLLSLLALAQAAPNVEVMMEDVQEFKREMQFTQNLVVLAGQKNKPQMLAAIKNEKVHLMKLAATNPAKAEAASAQLVEMLDVVNMLADDNYDLVLSKLGEQSRDLIEMNKKVVQHLQGGKVEQASVLLQTGETEQTSSAFAGVAGAGALAVAGAYVFSKKKDDT